MRDLTEYRRRLLSLRELNPLWVLSLGVVVLALAAGGLVQRHLNESARLEDRLSGGALVDALRLYAQATEPGQPVRPASIADLVDDTRGGQHRTWLDTASAAALGNDARWSAVRDGDGRLVGMQQRDAGASGGLLALLGGAPADPATQPYILQEVPMQAAAPEPAPAPAVDLPQPVMPIGGLPAVAQADDPAGPAAAAVASSTVGARSGLPAQAVASAARPPVGSPPAGNTAGMARKPSRIIAGLEARQVLRLSGGGDEPPLIVPRHTQPAGTAATTHGGGAATAPASITTRRQAAPTAAPTPVPGGASVAPVAPVRPDRARPAQTAAVPAPVAAERFAPSYPVPLPPGVPLNVPMSPPAANGARVDTVIYEEPPAPADASLAAAAAVAPAAPPASCRALAGDSAECDALDDSNGGLYQRCYQSLSERINACLAGEPLPPLVNR